MHLNLAHLSYVIAVARAGSITGASTEIGISQPAISAAISGLEKSFGYKLFVRNRAKGLSLTPTGQHFVNRAQELLDDVSGFQSDVQGFGAKIAGEVRVSCYHVISPYVLPPVISGLAVKHPSISVRLTEGTLVEAVNNVKEGISDIAITYDMFDDSTVHLEKLLPVRPHVLMARSHPLAQQQSVSLAELGPHPFVMLDLPGVREYYQTLFRQRNIQPDVRFRARSLELVRSMVGLNLGYSFALLPIQTQRSYTGDIVTRRPLRDEVEEAHLCLVSPRELPRPRKTEAFVQVCRDSIASAILDHTKGMFQSPSLLDAD